MSNFLRDKRRKEGILAKKVAADLNISRRTLIRKENGQTLREKDVEIFAKYYGISKEEIFKNYEVKHGQVKKD